jgi:IS30 family transposase
MVRRVPEHERRKILKLIAGGSSYREVIAATGRSRAHIARVVTGMDCWVTQPSWHPSPTRLSLAEREEISRGLEVGRTFATIAAGLERSASTVSREVKANGGRQAYRAYRANREACTRARRPRPT